MSKNARKGKNTLSFDIDAEDDIIDGVGVKRKNPGMGLRLAPVFTKKRKRAPPPAKVAHKPKVEASHSVQDIEDAAVVVDESEVYSDNDVVCHILDNFSALNIHNIVSSSDIHHFRLFLYSKKHNQEKYFRRIYPNTARFDLVYSKIRSIIVDISHDWDGTTFKDKFISEDNITPVKIQKPQAPTTITRKVKINQVVLKRLGIKL